MTWTRYAAGFALAALLVDPAAAQAPTADTAAQPAQAQAVQPQAAPAEHRLAEGVVATVNDEIISSYDLRQRMMLLIATSGVQPSAQDIPAIQQQALRSLVDERLQMQELKRFEVKVEDAEVDQEIDSIAKESKSSKDALLSTLAQAGVQPATFRDQLRAEIGWRMLVGGRYSSRARIGADQIDQTLTRIAAAAAKPQYLVGEIYLDAATVGGMDEAMNGARQLVDQIAKGAPFQSVARQFSNAPSAASGGDAGWLIQGEIDPKVQDALEHMHGGQLSLPIQTDGGVWIVYLREKRAGGLSTLVKLKQVAIKMPADATADQLSAAQAKLTAVQPKLTCENLEKEVGKHEGLVAADLGESNVDELSPEIKAVTDTMKVGQVAGPVRTNVGVHLVALCGKRQSGGDLPSRDQVENRLYGQQLTMLAQRYLRDLRNSATIETR